MPFFTGVIGETGQQRFRRVDVVRGEYVFVTTTGVAQFAVDMREFWNTMGGTSPQRTRPQISLVTNVGVRRMA